MGKFIIKQRPSPPKIRDGAGHRARAPSHWDGHHAAGPGPAAHAGTAVAARATVCLGTPGCPQGYWHGVRVRPRSRHPSPRLDIQAPSPLRWDARPACHVHTHGSAPLGVQQVPGGVTVPSPRARGSGLGTRAAGPGAGKRRTLRGRGLGERARRRGAVHIWISHACVQRPSSTRWQK